eukprot:ctg_2515.g503
MHEKRRFLLYRYVPGCLMIPNGRRRHAPLVQASNAPAHSTRHHVRRESREAHTAHAHRQAQRLSGKSRATEGVRVRRLLHAGDRGERRGVGPGSRCRTRVPGGVRPAHRPGGGRGVASQEQAAAVARSRPRRVASAGRRVACAQPLTGGAPVRAVEWLQHTAPLCDARAAGAVSGVGSVPDADADAADGRVRPGVDAGDDGLASHPSGVSAQRAVEDGAAGRAGHGAGCDQVCRTSAHFGQPVGDVALAVAGGHRGHAVAILGRSLLAGGAAQFVADYGGANDERSPGAPLVYRRLCRLLLVGIVRCGSRHGHQDAIHPAARQDRSGTLASAAVAAVDRVTDAVLRRPVPVAPGRVALEPNGARRSPVAAGSRRARIWRRVALTAANTGEATRRKRRDGSTGLGAASTDCAFPGGQRADELCPIALRAAVVERAQQRRLQHRQFDAAHAERSAHRVALLPGRHQRAGCRGYLRQRPRLHVIRSRLPHPGDTMANVASSVCRQRAHGCPAAARRGRAARGSIRRRVARGHHVMCRNRSDFFIEPLVAEACAASASM